MAPMLTRSGCGVAVGFHCCTLYNNFGYFCHILQRLVTNKLPTVNVVSMVAVHVLSIRNVHLQSTCSECP